MPSRTPTFLRCAQRGLPSRSTAGISGIPYGTGSEKYFFPHANLSSMVSGHISKDTKQFQNGFRIERKEHPTLPKHLVEIVVTDHIRIHKNAYKK